MTLNIYCDGSCRNNGSPTAIGAWGFVAIDTSEQIKEVQHSTENNTTNQKMELLAAIHACIYAETQITSALDIINIYTDSAYLYNCYSQKWYEKWSNNGWLTSKKEPVSNVELWKQIIQFFDHPQFYFHKVAGHADNRNQHEYWNNYIDNIVQNDTLLKKETLIKNTNMEEEYDSSY